MISLLVTLFIVLVIAAIVYWVISILPIPANFKWIFYAILGLIVIIYLLAKIGIS